MTGGVATFTDQFVRRLPAHRVVVLAPNTSGASRYDAGLPFPVHRYNGSLLADHALSRRLRALVAEYELESAWITAAAPLALLAPRLRRAGIGRIVASSHGQESAWARLPLTRAALRTSMRSVDVLTYLTDIAAATLKRTLGDVTELVPLSGGVDTRAFPPGQGREYIRSRHRLGSRPVVITLSRLVKRKGHDRLIEAWPAIRRAVPDVALLIAGDGPQRRSLERRAASIRHSDSVVFTGSIEPSELPSYLAAADLFALPVRDRWHGLETEGLGLALLEASAAGLPVVAGRSGGTPAAVLDGHTGCLVDGRDSGQVADAIIRLLSQPAHARAMGAAGREWVERAYSWDALAARLTHQLLAQRTDSR